MFITSQKIGESPAQRVRFATRGCCLDDFVKMAGYLREDFRTPLALPAAWYVLWLRRLSQSFCAELAVRIAKSRKRRPISTGQVA